MLLVWYLPCRTSCRLWASLQTSQQSKCQLYCSSFAWYYLSRHAFEWNWSLLRSTSYWVVILYNGIENVQLETKLSVSLFPVRTSFSPVSTFVVLRERNYLNNSEALIAWDNLQKSLLFWTTPSFKKTSTSPALIFVPFPHSPSGSNLEVIAEILLRTLRNSTNHLMNVVTQKLKSHAGGIFDSSYKAFGNRGKSFVF